MAGVNKVILVGNLGADPEARSLNNGGEVVNLRVATSESWKDRQSGERKEKTEWHQVAIFDERQKLRFSVQQMIDAMSPANFLATNPEAQQQMIETQGESLTKGLTNMLTDMQKGRISQSDESAFEVGVNVGTAPGQVVYENDLFQLILDVASGRKRPWSDRWGLFNDLTLFNPAPITRHDNPAARPREISSRSAGDNRSTSPTSIEIIEITDRVVHRPLESATRLDAKPGTQTRSIGPLPSTW